MHEFIFVCTLLFGTYVLYNIYLFIYLFGFPALWLNIVHYDMILT